MATPGAAGRRRRVRARRAVLFTVGLFMIGDRQMAFAKKFTIYTEFKKITGLQPGAIVRVSGAKAGAIKQISAEEAERQVPRRARNHRRAAPARAHRLARIHRDRRPGRRQLSRRRDRQRQRARCAAGVDHSQQGAVRDRRSACSRWATRSTRSTRRSTR